ncbi:hypothetical protein [Pseudonocardia zijingensis]|uniref:Secreted protein with PEP-CTERM sorting signal n=1 Tax=Pseudonocardia zijingensis TaxID=153376 RepID=A0ABN1QH73_9PSEU
MTLPRPALWVLLVVAVVANGLTSMSTLPPAVGIAFGVLALVLVVLLVRDYIGRRGGGASPR